MSGNAKSKATKALAVVGASALGLGFIPGFLSYQWGLVIFIFSLVAIMFIKIVLPQHEDEPPDESEE